MGTTSQKLTYLAGTKDKLKTTINYTGAGIDNTTTFRKYDEKLYNAIASSLINNQTIFDNMPKVNGSGSSLTLNNTTESKMQLTYKGNTQQDGEPTPDSPQTIHSVTGDNDIEVCGKNLFDKTTAEVGGINRDTGALTTNTTFRASQYIKVIPNETYYIQNGNPYYGAWYDKDKNYISPYNSNGKTVGTAPTNAKYIRFTTEPSKIDTTMFFAGSTATPYEAYTGQSQLISLGDIELNKIGDYQDYIYKENNKWYLHKEIGKVVLDGSEIDWSVDTNLNELYYYHIPINDKHNNGIILSNNFKQIDSLWTLSTAQNCCITEDNKIIGFMLEDQTISNVSDWTTWLSTHNTEVYYVLDTTTDTEITDYTLYTQLETIKNSYENQTNISQTNNDLPFILDVKAIQKYE